MDVLRTDGELEFFRRKENLGRLMDLLAVYAWLDPDVGYCQGLFLSLNFIHVLLLGLLKF